MARVIETETERLRLRQWCEEDFQVFALMNADSRVMEYFSSTLSRDVSDQFALNCQLLIAERGWGLWALEEKETGQFAGFTGLNIPGHKLPFSPCVEIGWRLVPAFWGKGFATEAARTALDIGFDALNLDEIVSFTAVDNSRSRAVMERLGMLQEQHSFHHPTLSPNHRLSEHCLYRLSKAHWQAMK